MCFNSNLQHATLFYVAIFLFFHCYNVSYLFSTLTAFNSVMPRGGKTGPPPAKRVAPVPPRPPQRATAPPVPPVLQKPNGELHPCEKEAARKNTIMVIQVCVLFAR